MSRVRRSLLLLLALSSVSTWATREEYAAIRTEGPIWAEPKEDMAVVYFIRRGQFAGGGRTMFLYADDRFVGTLDNESYTFAYFEPGRYMLWTNWTKVNVDIDLSPNSETYVVAWGKLEIVDEAAGRELIEQIKSFAEPSAKETAKSEKHIANRLREAHRRAQRQGRADLETIAAPTMPRDSTGMIRVPKYTEVQLMLMENVTTHHSETGEEVWFRVTEDVVCDGETMLSEGALVQGTVRRAAGAEIQGEAGQVNIVIPGIAFVDGTPVATIGQISDAGRSRADTSGTVAAVGMVTVGIIPGAIAGTLVKGREAFVLAGDTCSVWTADEAWVRPASVLKDRNEELEPEGIEEVAVSSIAHLKLQPHRRAAPGDVAVVLDADRRPTKVSVYRVDGWVLPTEVVALEIDSAKGGGWSCSFGGWELARFLRPKGLTADIPIELRGTFADGTRFLARTRVELKLDVEE